MIIQDRMAPKVDREFVLFLIGMRINKFHKMAKWLPIFASMPRMIKELEGQKDLGLMHARFHPGCEPRWLTGWTGFRASMRRFRVRVVNSNL